MNRKYLNDIGHTSRWDNNWGEGLKEEDETFHANQRSVYGFDSRETFNLDNTFCEWLYERLMMFREIADKYIDMRSDVTPRFEWQGKQYSQGELIDLLIERLKYYFTEDECDPMDLERAKKEREIPYIWAVLFPAMWW